MPSSKPIIGTHLAGTGRGEWLHGGCSCREFIHAGNWGIIGRHFFSKCPDRRYFSARFIEEERCTEYIYFFFIKEF